MQAQTSDELVVKKRYHLWPPIIRTFFGRLNNVIARELVEIESDSFRVPWSREDFCDLLEAGGIIDVAMSDDGVDVVGYACFLIDGRSAELVNLAVKREWRGLGVGEFLAVRRLDEEIDVMTAAASEENLDAQLFLKQIGFKATQILKGFYEDGTSSYSFRIESGGNRE